MTEDEMLMQSTAEEQEFWLKCVKGLPGLEGFSGTGYAANGERIPWGSGPHNLKAFREIIKIVKPTHIFEIGFNIGYSAAMWLNVCDAKVTSIDISDKKETLVAANFLEDINPTRFQFQLGDSLSVYNRRDFKRPKFDMAFIDGSHLEEYVSQDILVCWKLGIQWLVMDDWLPRFGPGVQTAVKKFPLEVVAVLGNTALVKFLNIWKD